MLRTGLLAICVAVLAASTVSEAASRQSAGRNAIKVVMSAPLNDAAIEGAGVTLSCRTTPGDRTQWIEFITTSAGGIISDNGTISGNYPRYSMNNDHSEGWFNLTLNPLQVNDGGRFRCQDEITSDYADAEVVVLQATGSSCTSTVQSNGVIILGSYYSVTCLLYYGASSHITPSTVWTGPGDFNFGQANGTDINGTTIIQSALSFIAQKAMDGQRYAVQTYFEPRYFGQTPGSSSNTPSFTATTNMQFLFVQYGPWNISYTPVKDSYELGETITCFADARPLATYQWTNMQTGQIYASQSLVTQQEMIGTYTFRCQMYNAYGTQNIFQNITVNPITTPTPTTPTTVTTPVPAVANCKDLSGKWTSTRTDGTVIELCLYVNTSANGAIKGFLMNNTKIGSTIELVGATRNQIFDETGLVGIWEDDTGVSALAVECHNCYGVESVIVNVVSRTEQDDLSCGDGGALQNSELYKFSRGAWDTTTGYCFQI